MKPNYKMLENTLSDKLREVQNLMIYLDKSDFDRNADDLVFSVLEVQFAIEKAIKHSKILAR